MGVSEAFTPIVTPGTKFLPSTVMITGSVLATIEVGETDVTTGTGLSIVKLREVDDGWKFASPEYSAITVWIPAVANVVCALASLDSTGAVASVVAPSRNVT